MLSNAERSFGGLSATPTSPEAVPKTRIKRVRRGRMRRYPLLQAPPCPPWKSSTTTRRAGPACRTRTRSATRCAGQPPGRPARARANTDRRRLQLVSGCWFQCCWDRWWHPPAVVGRWAASMAALDLRPRRLDPQRVHNPEPLAGLRDGHHSLSDFVWRRCTGGAASRQMHLVVLGKMDRVDREAIHSA